MIFKVILKHLLWGYRFLMLLVFSAIVGCGDGGGNSSGNRDALPGITDFTASPAANGVLLNWINPDSDNIITGFNIIWQEIENPVSRGLISLMEGQVNLSSLAAVSYPVSGLRNGINYAFSVTIFYADGSSSVSSRVPGDPAGDDNGGSDGGALPGITNLMAFPVADGVLLNWTNPASDSITGFYIIWQETANLASEMLIPLGEGQVNLSSLAAVSYPVDELRNGTNYVFSVLVSYANGNSSASSRVEEVPGGDAGGGDNGGDAGGGDNGGDAGGGDTGGDAGGGDTGGDAGGGDTGGDAGGGDTGGGDGATALPGITNLTAFPVANGMLLNWINPDSDNIIGFRIYWDEILNPLFGGSIPLAGDRVNISALAAVTYRVNALKDETNYAFSVTVFYTNGNSSSTLLVERVPGFNTDGDRLSDANDPDDDNDGVNDFDNDGMVRDNCRTVANPEQINTDGNVTDGGNACDDDDDNDGVNDFDNNGMVLDNCRTVVNPDQNNTDGNVTDGGDACDDDDDNDNTLDTADNCPLIANNQSDIDGDTFGDLCDPCPNGARGPHDTTTDMDGDGCVNANDSDYDNNGLIEISYLEELAALNNDLDANGIDEGRVSKFIPKGSAGCPSGDGCHGYELTRSLDFNDDTSYLNASENKDGWISGSGWSSIGECFPFISTTQIISCNSFTGEFNGNGYTIAGLYVGEGCRVLGCGALFASASNSVFKNLQLTDVSIQGASAYAAMLVGEVGSGRLEIDNVRVFGNVSSRLEYAGGLVGGVSALDAEVIIKHSSAEFGQIKSFNYAGGLIGFNGFLRPAEAQSRKSIRIISSYARGESVASTSTTSRHSGSGGLIGGTDARQGARVPVIVKSSYANIDIITSNSAGTDRSFGAGGLLGTKVRNVRIEASYAKIGQVDAKGGSVHGFAGVFDDSVARVNASYATFGRLRSAQVAKAGLVSIAGTNADINIGDSYWDNQSLFSSVAPENIFQAEAGRSADDLRRPNNRSGFAGIYANWADYWCDPQTGDFLVTQTAPPDARFVRAWNFGSEALYPVLACTPDTPAHQWAKGGDRYTSISQLNGIPGMGSMLLSWDNPNRRDIASFNITWEHINNRTRRAVVPVAGTPTPDNTAAFARVSHSIEGLTNDVVHEFEVIAIYEDGTVSPPAGLERAPGRNTDGDELADIDDDDDDDDGRPDTADNCRAIANRDQRNTDRDGEGDVCDDNDDNDERLDGDDNCRLVINNDQTDTDGDGMGDACDGDDDNDGRSDSTDNCPLIVNDQINTDGDALGDACDDDDDNDEIPDTRDNCQFVFNPTQANADGLTDGGDVCDNNDDNDGWLDSEDNCPLVPNNDQADMDSDSLGNLCDACPNGIRGTGGVGERRRHSEVVDMDGDGCVISFDSDNNGNGLIEIDTLEELAALNDDLDGDGIDDGSHPDLTVDKSQGCPMVGGCVGYELTRSLDFASSASYENAGANMPRWTGGVGWEPIGGCSTTTSCSSFSGIFDGNGETIAGLYINGRDIKGTGLFGAVADSVIKNLRLTDVSITGITKSAVGMLVGHVDAGSLDIDNVRVGGNLSTGQGGVGGLLGSTSGARKTSVRIVRSSAHFGELSAIHSFNNDNLGGLIGIAAGPHPGGDPLLASDIVSIVASYARGGSLKGGRNVGGLVGQVNQGKLGSIEGSYADIGSINVSATNGPAGGLIGYVAGPINILASYAKSGQIFTSSASPPLGGGLVGDVFEDPKITINASYAVTGELISMSSASPHTRGGLVGVSASPDEVAAIVNSYWDNQVNMGTVINTFPGDRDAGRSTEALRQPDNATGFGGSLYESWGNFWCDPQTGDFRVLQTPPAETGFIQAWNLGNSSQYPVLTCTPDTPAAQWQAQSSRNP